MKHNYLKHLFTVLLLLCSTIASAHDFEVEGIYYKITDAVNKTVAVTYRGSYSGEYSNEYSGAVTIPASVTHNGTSYRVTSIEGGAFYSCSGLISVVIPNSVTSIGYNAFEYCTGLTSIVVKEGNTVYDSRNNCNAVIETATNTLVIGCKNTIIPDGITSIGYCAFYNCPRLTSIEIPNSVTSIGEGAFSNCSGLKSIEIPNSVTSIGDNAFYYCSGLTSIEIPNSVTSIGEGAFYYCSGLKSIVIPNSVTSIDEGAFDYTAWYNAQPDGIIYAGKVLYKYKGKMPANTSIIVKEGTTGIVGSAFYGCSSLTSITIPNSVTSIGNRAFSNCTGLTSIVIPNSVTSIGDYTFYGCSGLTSIVVKEGNTVYDSRNNCNALIETATNTLVKGSNNTIIPDGITSIGSDAFSGCSGLTSIEIPNSVTSIGNEAFYDCTGLTSVVIGNSVTSIGYDAFRDCTSLTSIVIPNSVTSIGDYTFYGCSGLTSVVIGNSVTNIGNNAFRDCSSLTSVTSLIPAENLFAINSYVFDGVDKTNCTLYVPAGAKETYAATEGWSEFTNIVELEKPITEVTITINQYGNATYCSPYALDFSEIEGLKAYAATGYKANSQVVTLTRVETAEAGIGLFLKGEPGEYVVPVIESTDEHSLNMLVGTLEQTTVNSTDGVMSNYKFTITEGDEAPMFYPFEDNTTLSAGKAYLQIPTAWLPVTAQKAALSIRFDNGLTTDIEDIEEGAWEENTYYDLQGRKVENPSNGIYIINGKKVFIK